MNTVLVVVFRIIYWTGLHRLFSIFYGGAGSILTFHRVLRDRDSASMLPTAKTSVITPEYLDELLSLCRKRGYRFISIDDLPDVLSSRSPKSSQKFLICSFDDGYRDVYETAYPVLKKHGVPFIIYVSSGFTERTGFLWWDVISDILLHEKELVLLRKGEMVRNDIRPENRDQLFGAARKCILEYSRDELLRYQQFVTDYYGVDTSVYPEKGILSWKALREIAEDPLCTIGAHSENHLAMKYQTEDVVRSEIINCRNAIENNLGGKVKHFAFPYGGPDTVTARDISIAGSVGFTTVCTTRRTNIFAEHYNYLYTLPRINIAGGRKTDIIRQSLWLSGMLPAIKYKGRKLVF
jgi:peptidoglycan/xylan/chitin deacetylase (PgdA/CDA1 family)